MKSKIFISSILILNLFIFGFYSPEEKERVYYANVKLYNNDDYTYNLYIPIDDNLYFYITDNNIINISKKETQGYLSRSDYSGSTTDYKVIFLNPYEQAYYIETDDSRSPLLFEKVNYSNLPTKKEISQDFTNIITVGGIMLITLFTILKR